MFQSQNIYIYVPIHTKLRLFTQGTVEAYLHDCRLTPVCVEVLRLFVELSRT